MSISSSLALRSTSASCSHPASAKSKSARWLITIGPLRVASRSRSAAKWRTSWLPRSIAQLTKTTRSASSPMSRATCARPAGPIGSEKPSNAAVPYIEW